MEDGVVQALLAHIHEHSCPEDAHYVSALLRITLNVECKPHPAHDISTTALRLIHLLYRHQEVKIYRRVTCRDLDHTIIFPAHIALSEDAQRVLMWDELPQHTPFGMGPRDRTYHTLSAFLKFISDIEDQIHFTLPQAQVHYPHGRRLRHR